MLSFVTLLSLVAGCHALPRDAEGTIDRIKESRTLKVGVVESASPEAHQRSRRFVDQLANSMHARAQETMGASEPLLVKLKQGELDLVIGEFSKESPWVAEVSFLPPPVEVASGEEAIELVPIARNGENEWVSHLHREIRRWQ